MFNQDLGHFLFLCLNILRTLELLSAVFGGFISKLIEYSPFPAPRGVFKLIVLFPNIYCA